MSICITNTEDKVEVELKCNETLVEFDIEIYRGNTCVFRIDLDNIAKEFTPDNSNLSFFVRRTPQSRDVLFLDDSLGGGMRRIKEFQFEFELSTEVTGSIPAMEYIFYIKMEFIMHLKS